VIGKQVNGSVVNGEVFVKFPAGTASAHAASTLVPPGGVQQKGFIPLTEPRQLPVGTQVDARKGTIAITTATGSGKKTQTGQFGTGVFKINQSRSKKAKGLTELALLEDFPGGPAFSQCSGKAARAARAGSAKSNSKIVQLLRSSVKGKFRTRGRYAAATVRGTVWDTVDRCDGTLVSVHRGVVVVTDLRHHRNVSVRAGHSYLAKSH
jgi:hypothetical protein